MKMKNNYDVCYFRQVTLYTGEATLNKRSNVGTKFDSSVATMHNKKIGFFTSDVLLMKSKI